MFKALRDAFHVNLSDYGFGVDFAICEFLLAILIGVALAALAAGFLRAARTSFLRALLRHKAIGEDHARTLAELRMDSRVLIRYAVRHRGGEFARLVARVGEVSPTYEEYLAAQKLPRARRAEQARKARVPAYAPDARFYLREDGVSRARRLCEQVGNSPLGAILIVVCLALFYALLLIFMPHILSFVSGFFPAG